MRALDQTWLILGRSERIYRLYGPDLVFHGGQSVSTLGDIDRDGYNDCATVDAAGRINVYFSAGGFEGTPSLVYQQDETATATLVGVEPAGDFNGDGAVDFFATLLERVSDTVIVATVRLYAGPHITVSAPSRIGSGSAYIELVRPNPFNPVTQIRFRGEEGKRIRLEAFDIRGRKVDVVYDATGTGSEQVVDWHPRNLPSGVYVLRLVSGGSEDTASVTLLK